MLVFICLITRISCRSHYERQEMPVSYTQPITTAEKYLFIWFNSTIVAVALFAAILWPVLRISNAKENILMLMPYQTWLTIFTIQAGWLLSCCWIKGNPLKAFLPLTGTFLLYHIIHIRNFRIINRRLCQRPPLFLDELRTALQYSRARYSAFGTIIRVQRLYHYFRILDACGMAGGVFQIQGTDLK